MFADDAEAHAMLDARFVNGPTRWLGLSTTVPRLEGGRHVDFTEPDAPSYARVEVPASEWPEAFDRAVQTEVVFPDLIEDWGVIVAWGYFDTPTGGTPRWPGVPEEGMDLAAGASNVTVATRVDFPAS